MNSGLTKRTRCPWAGSNTLYIKYHDKEWGVPVYDDKKLFEFLTLEGAQAGLSWLTVLKKRKNYREAFANFNPERVARFNKTKVNSLLKNPGIIRNRLKVESTISNAQAFLKILDEFGSFNHYQWQFIGGKPLQNYWKSLKELPATSKESDLWSKDMKKRGFRFVGSTILYAHMQAVGMVNDHLTTCFRHAEIKRKIF